MSSRTMKARYATGSHLPLEVLDNVVLSFTDLSAHPTRGVEMSKHELCMCSLVCRLWARRCRPHIFWSTRILSFPDFNHFLSLIDSEKAFPRVYPIAGCISYMEIRHSGTWTVPWFHQIRHELASRHIHLDADNISLEIEGAQLPHDEGSRGYAPVSLSTSLPRTLPRTAFSHGSLLLTDLHFRTMNDLIRLMDGQPVLESVNWKRLTFDKPTEGEVQLPRPRVRRRRPWEGLINFTTTQWAEIDIEIHLVYVIVAEKLNTSLPALSDWWTTMARATRALLLPSTRQLEFGVNENVVRVAFEAPDPSQHFTHDIEYHLEVSPSSFTYVSLFRICIQYPDKPLDLEAINWTAFEEGILSMSPVPEVEIHVVSRDRADIFKWVLDAISTRKILSRLNDRGALDAGFPANSETWYGAEEYQYLSFEEVMAFPSEYVVDGRTLTLSESQKFELWLCEDDVSREGLLKSITSGSSADASIVASVPCPK